MPTFKIQHRTEYHYDRFVRDSSNQIKIYPYHSPHQDTTRHELIITGDPMVSTFTDYWGNQVGWFMVNEPHKHMSIESRLVVKTLALGANPLETATPLDWEAIQTGITTDIRLLDLSQTEPMKNQVAIQAILADLKPDSETPAIFIQRCSEYIFHNFLYYKGITTVETTVDEILELRSGVCQDFAHLLLQILRTAGIPARYVSGYICPNKDGARGAGATHAWVEAWLPTLGWVGIDPTNNTWVSDRHVTLAVGRHFGDCSPIKGTFKGPANQELKVYVGVSYEDGSTFEDNNLVQMTKEPVQVQRIVIEEGMQQQ